MNRPRELVLLTLALTLWFGLFLGVRPLGNPDEGRYTEIPREMVATGDYVTPRLNGVKYFEKPPLVYWLSALTFELAGVNEWSARLWTALFAVGGGLVTYTAGRALYGRAAGWWSALVLSTALLYYALSRIILLDLVVAVTMSAALFAFVLGTREPAGRRRMLLFWAFYVGMALSVLTKGLIGFVLPCAVAFVWLLIFNQWRSLRPCHPLTGVLILLALAAPWHVLVALANPSAEGSIWPGYARGLALHVEGKDPGWLWFYFVREHFLRFTTTEHGHFEPWWFFPPVLVAGLFPWVVFAWQAVQRSIAGGWRARVEDREAWFLIVWVVFIVAFFSSSQSKLVPYILPVFPAAAVLIGRYLAEAWERGTTRGLRAGLWTFVGLSLALSAAAAVYPVPAKYAATVGSLLGWRILLGVILISGGGFVAWAAVRSRARVALIAMAAATGVLFTSLNFVVGRFDRRSTKSLALELAPRLRPGDAIFVVSMYAQDFPVYLGRLVDVVDYRGEMDYGINAEPEMSARRFIDFATFHRRWSEGPMAFALIKKASLDSVFRSASMPYIVVAENAVFVVVANRSAR